MTAKKHKQTKHVFDVFGEKKNTKRILTSLGVPLWKKCLF